MRTRNTISRLIRLGYVAFILTPSKPIYIYIEPHYVHRNTCITVFLILHSLYVSASSSIFLTTNSFYYKELNYGVNHDHTHTLIRASHVSTFEFSVVTDITIQFVPYYDKNSLNFPFIPFDRIRGSRYPVRVTYISSDDK